MQQLLRRVKVRPHSLVPGLRSKWLDTYSWRYPEEMPCTMTVTLRDGRTVSIEKRDYRGFFKRPLPREWIVRKFHRLAAGSSLDPDRIVEAASRLESITMRELVSALRA